MYAPSKPMPTAIAIVPSMLPIEGGGDEAGSSWKLFHCDVFHGRLDSLVATAPPLPRAAVLTASVVAAAITAPRPTLTTFATFSALTAFVIGVTITALGTRAWTRHATTRRNRTLVSRRKHACSRSRKRAWI